MNIFTQEHKDIREKNGTTKQVEYYLNTIARDEIDENLKFYLESLRYFFFATSSKNGDTNVNFKGAKSNTLIKVLDEKRFIFPDYSGNGIFHGIGDIATNPKVALLCIDFLSDTRVKISGSAKIIDDNNELIKYRDIFDCYDVERVIEISVEYIIPNCSNQLSVVREQILENMKNN